MITLPPPPPNLAEWLVLLALIATTVGAMRQWLVNPLLGAIREHAEEHQLVVRELTPNGSSEAELPEALRRKPLRRIAIHSYIALENLKAEVEEHHRFSRDAIDLINVDREARGLPPVRRPE